MDEYLFEFEGKTFAPSGRKEIAITAEEHNKALEQDEIEWLKTAPDKCFLYVHRSGQHVMTWKGTVVSDLNTTQLGPKRIVGFQSYVKGGTYRRSISCKIFGVQYHGWYMESSGDYCRLKRAKTSAKK